MILLTSLFILLVLVQTMNEELIGIPSDDEELNAEADKLFQWTQELSFDELDRVTGSVMAT